MANPKTSRRSDAAKMAASQKEISVSEFFSKNRHLLGFDNPRKALLTTVKEAVDNSLDACEEAGILPEIWVHIEPTSAGKYKVGVQDNGPGILKKQIPLIFGKLLYGSKFHRLRQSRGQQGIGISAAGMYGVQTTGKPVKIVSKISKGKPAHYYEIQIDTKKNEPRILNGKGEGEDIPTGDKGIAYIEKHGIEWVPQDHGTRVTIELEAKYVRGRGSVDEYLEQTAIANPHITLHYIDPESYQYDYLRSAEVLPPEAKEIKPHPYGVEIGRLATMVEEAESSTASDFFKTKFSRVTPAIAKKICETAKVSTRTSVKKLDRPAIEKLYEAIQATKISPPATDCICPIGEDLILRGLHHVVPAEFYAAATRPPAVYRGNPFVVEVGLAYGGAAPTQNVTMDLLIELLEETDTRTVRQFLINTFNGLGAEAADRIVKESGLKTRQTPNKLKPKEREKLFEAMKNVNVAEGQQMDVLRFANRVPLQFQQAACAVTQTVLQTNWRGYGLSQSRGSLPKGPVRLMVHIASVWVPFTSESKEAIAAYPEIQKEIRLGLQSVGRKLGMFLRRRQKTRQQTDRREVFMRYLKEVAGAVSTINAAEEKELYEQLVTVAQKHTADADVKMDDRGRKIVDDPTQLDLGENVLIVDPAHHQAAINRVVTAPEAVEPSALGN
ncbi:DNA topoisomerase VI subunit B [Botrimarina mediterranea]|uniref:Type 2 DNA topoisomerase 6 subunit B n=1 Tax=Botrimarina mediterranea TaxID=2528022 RepID=A0A518KCV7_9BACT|nr:DNA topoisomerase VI subunit B [Botrimarina mediterranea]QDV75630.1 DNA topoisomerase VI subunit B [Botrimarina mediterranea]QDV80265.1 DNA topoisomerase VI subunit B [Planctomycetes bacterium K2D]